MSGAGGRGSSLAYPDLDMVRYWRYEENNNPPALLEYGDRSKPEHFEFLHAYSPYEHLDAGIEYPAVLLTTGEGDTPFLLRQLGIK